MTQAMTYTVAGPRPSTFIVDSLSASSRNDFHFVPHSELSDCSRYICFLPLITTYALTAGFPAPIAPYAHALDLFPGDILKAASEKRCMLVLDTAPEGDPLVAAGYEYLAAWLETNGVAQSQVMIVNQNRELGQQYRKIIGGGIRFSVYDSHVKKLLNIFAEDDDAFSRAVGFGRNQIRARKTQETTKTFLSLNGAPRSHRIVFVSALSSYGLLEDTVWSMLGQKSGKLEPSAEAALALRDALGLEFIQNSDIEYVFAQMPKFIAEEAGDMSNIRGSDALALSINHRLFDLGLCSIATETEFSAGDVRRVSELSLKPFAMGHPAVLCGNPGSLALIRSFGFETFHPYIDETYDEITDPAERFKALISTVRSIKEQRRGGQLDLLMIENICARNIEIARGRASEAYEQSVERQLLIDLRTMFNEA